MSMSVRNLAIIGLIAFAAALAGVFVGRMLADAPRPRETELHTLLHRELRLSPDQKARIEAIETRFAARRDALEKEMRATNIRLAKAIDAEHGYGPQVTAAIDHSHDVMGELQKETLQHLFAMRGILSRAQADVFDRRVAEALTADAR